MKRQALSFTLMVIIFVVLTTLSIAESTNVAISVTPAVLILGEQGEWVTVHTDIPYSTVDTSAPVTLNDVDADILYIDSTGNLVAKYDQETFKEMYGYCTDPTDISMVFSGTYKDGLQFIGEDTVTVKALGKNN